MGVDVRETCAGIRASTRCDRRSACSHRSRYNRGVAPPNELGTGDQSRPGRKSVRPSALVRRRSTVQSRPWAAPAATRDSTYMPEVRIFRRRFGLWESLAAAPSGALRTPQRHRHFCDGPGAAGPILGQ